MEEKVGVATATPESEEGVKETPQDSEVTKLKQALSRANSEAAEYKRQLREKQTKEEADAADRAERERKRDEELEALRAEVKASKRERTTANYAKSLMGVGYDAETADLMASTLPDGVGADFFEKLKAFQDRQRQTLVAENYGKQPSLSVGTPPQSAEELEKEKLRKYIGL